MRRLVLGLVIGSLVLGGMALPAEARSRHRGHHKHDVRHHNHHVHRPGRGHDHFFGGFQAGAGTVLILDALVTPRVAHAPRVVYQPVYYRAPVCQDVWVAGRWELRPLEENGFTTYYQVWLEGHWQRQCS